jgi:hypothetical protein
VLEEVNANPGGRKLILEMLFRENVKEVTEGDLVEKKRVRVKKRRKKTEEERRRGQRDGEENGASTTANEKKKWAWWGEEKVKRGGSAAEGEDQERIVICISSDGLETDMDQIINHASCRLYDVSDCEGSKDEEMGVVTDENEGDKEKRENERNGSSVVTQVAVADDASQVESLSPMSDNSETQEEQDFDGNDDARNNAAACGVNSHLDLKSWDESSAAGDDSAEGAAQIMHQVETPRTANHRENEQNSKKVQAQRLGSPELPDEESFGNITVQLAPRIRSQRSLDNDTQLPQVLEPPFIQSNGPGNVSPISPCFEDGQDAWNRDPCGLATRSPALILPDLDSESNANNEESPSFDDRAVASPPSIFRKRKSDDKLSDMAIQPSMSNDTAVTSNVDELSKSDHFRGDIMPKLACADIIPSYKLKSVESYKTDGSSISYFSYEDVSIEDEESEMCAVCICPYEEGDIRVFSKHCSHVFHKDCIFEWLVKGHNECPCCRADMVTKSEIKATSASLIGTEQLNHAMQQATVEAPPFRARRGPRLPRHMLAVARREAWREWRASHQLQTNTTMPPQSPNAHWLWTARHQGINSGTAPQHAAPASAAATSPTNNINHNNDWLWTMRFDNTTNQNNSPRQLRTARSSDATDSNRPSGNALASRSSDGIGEHRANESALASRSFDALDSQRTSNQQPLYHNASAGSLAVGRNLHPNWSNCQNSTPARQNVAMSPMSHRLHPHWQQRAGRREVDPPLIEIPPRPAIQPISNESPQTLNGRN